MNHSSNSFDDLSLSHEATSIQQDLSAEIESYISKEQGQIDFSEFMRRALYTPRLGYYQNELQTFGRQGDFVTAPEMGALFAASVASSIEAYFSATGSTNGLLELGAGTGALAAEILTNLASKNALPHKYFILEPSASLQQIQKERISSCDPAIQGRVEWLTKLPASFDGIILANEVVDAIPFDRITCIDQQWVALGVTCEKGQFSNCLMQPVKNSALPSELVDLIESKQLVEGYTTEYRPQANAWIQTLSKSLNSGAILLLDYGYSASEYYHPQRASGTLSCFIRHHQHDDPFRFIGLQDITAHVDFTQIAKAAVVCGLQVTGFTSQAGFLLENGIAETAEEQTTALTAEQRFQLSQQMQKLLMPGQMGEVIKAILLTKPNRDNPAVLSDIKGFNLQDQLYRL